jgi:hypothetical protein
MMCLACEQDAMWFAYLQRKGLITPDGYLVEEPPSLFGPAETAPAATADAKAEENKGQDANKADSGSFSCDDPSAQ